MTFDAFDQGVKPGGLNSKREIRLLVCFLLANINQPIKRNHITSAAVQGEFANYFEISSAISDLIESGTITEDRYDYLHISEDKKKAMDLLEADLPFTIREQSTKLCTKLALQEIYKKENKVEITQTKRGYYVDCIMKAEDDDDILTFRLYCGTISQAELAKERFLDDPIAVYDSIINTMFPPKEK